MLCGKHVVNCILQGNQFSKESMDGIAEDLERAERNLNPSLTRGLLSQYCLPEGDYSIDVLKKALLMFDVRLIN